MKKIYLTLAAAVLVFASQVEAGAMLPGGVINLDINFDSTIGCAGGMHLVINNTSGLVTGRATGCLGADLLIGTVGNSPRLGTSISIMLPSTNQLFVIDDSPRIFTIYDADNFSNNHVQLSGEYFLGAP